MFANAYGGLLLIGVPEQRDQQGQPTGAPDPVGALGVEVPNPEAVLNAYDARVMEARSPACRFPCSETDLLTSSIRLRGISSLASQPVSWLIIFVKREASR